MSCMLELIESSILPKTTWIDPFRVTFQKNYSIHLHPFIWLPDDYTCLVQNYPLSSLYNKFYRTAAIKYIYIWLHWQWRRFSSFISAVRHNFPAKHCGTWTPLKSHNMLDRSSHLNVPRLDRHAKLQQSVKPGKCGATRQMPANEHVYWLIT